MKKEIIYAFIDGQNLYESLNRKGVVFSYEKLRKHLREKYHVAKAIMYLGDIHKDTYRKAERAGFSVQKKKSILQIDNYGKLMRKANIDVDLVVGALYDYYNNYDKAVIMTRDGDFVPLIKALIKEGKLDLVIVPNRETSATVFKEEWIKEKVVCLNDMEERVELLLQ